MHWQAADAWNKATDKEKAPHVAAAGREKEQYERLCDEYTVKRGAAAAADVAAMARHLVAAEVCCRRIYEDVNQSAIDRAEDLLSCLLLSWRLQLALYRCM